MRLLEEILKKNYQINKDKIINKYNDTIYYRGNIKAEEMFQGFHAMIINMGLLQIKLNFYIKK
jgi:hypothetical protein